ncbi:MAG: MlaD family protein [Planctomycetota bacterium]
MIAQNENWKVGLFVVGVITIGVVGLAALGARGLSRETIPLVAYFDESIDGVSVGTPVKFRGVDVGEVKKVAFAPDRRHVQVDIAAFVEDLGALGLGGAESIVGASLELEEEGIRLRIVRSALTGFTYLEADVFDPESRPIQELPFEKPYNYVPTEPSTLKTLEQDLSATLQQMPNLIRNVSRVVNEISAAIDELDVAQNSARLDSVLTRADEKLATLDVEALNALVRDVGSLVDAIDRDALARATERGADAADGFARVAAKLEEQSEHLDGVLEDTRSAAKAFEREVTEADLGATAEALRRGAGALETLAADGSRTAERALPALRELERALANVAALASRLERDPASIVFGVRTEEMETPATRRARRPLPLGACFAPKAPSYRNVETLLPVPVEPRVHSGRPVRLVEIAAHEASRDVFSWRALDGSIRRVEGVRWADQPADAVRRALLERLSGAPADGGPARRLSIELLSFGGEERRDGIAASIRAFVLVEEPDGSVALARTYEFSRPLEGGTAEFARVDRATCEALGRLTLELVDTVLDDASGAAPSNGG